MSDTKPVVIDADAFDPVPRNVFKYGGVEHKAFDLLQIPRAQREKVVRMEDHLNACRTIDDQVELAAGIVTAFVPSVSLDALRDDSIEKLLHCIQILATAGSDAKDEGDARPTRGQRRSGSRRSTRR